MNPLSFVCLDSYGEIFVMQLMEYSYLLDMADECEDPYVKMVYSVSWALSVYYGYKRPWKPFNPILGETYEMVDHNGLTFLSEQVSPQTLP
jgi:hypothetical protein